MSHGLGMRKQPLAWSVRNAARRAATSANCERLLGRPRRERNLRAAPAIGKDLLELLRIDRWSRLCAVLVEGLGQGGGHLVVGQLLEIGALQHEDLLAVLEEAHGGRGGGIGGQ